MMKKVTPIFLLLSIFASAVNAQNTDGYVKVSQSIEMDSLLSRDMKYHSDNPMWEGYRIQVFFDAGNNSKRKAQDVIEGFILEFEDIPAYLSFREPYYRVRVGNYHTRLQAAGKLEKIARIYPGAFVVKETINPQIPSYQELNPPEENKFDEELNEQEP
jgi:hypothetical protein